MKKLLLILGIIACTQLDAAVDASGYDSATDDFPAYDKQSATHEHNTTARREALLFGLEKAVANTEDAAVRIDALLKLGRTNAEKASAVDIALWIIYQKYPKLFKGYSQNQSWNEETP